MNAKKIVLVFGCIITLASCSQSDSVYDANYNKDLGIEIPDGFSWSTTKDVKTVVNVNDPYNGKFFYDVAIYSETPTTTSKPLAAGVANANEPFMASFVIPSSVSKVYITESLTDADGTTELIETKEVPVSDLGNVTMTNSSAAKAMTRGNGNGNGNGNKTLVFDYASDLAGCDAWDEITTTDGSEISFKTGRNYVIKKDAYFTVGAQSLNQGILYVKPGAHVKIAQRNEGNEVSVGTKSKIYNDGCITVLGDNSTFSVKEGSGFYNNGSLTAPNIDFKSVGGQIALCSNCFINTKKLDIAGGTITMKTGSWINADNITETQGQAGAILTSDATNISGYDYAALITTKSITSTNGITLQGNTNGKLLVQCPTKPITLGANAEYTTDALGKIVITARACCGSFGKTGKDFSPITYAMEDQYPNKSDFDLNDAVVTLTPTVTTINNTEGTKTNITINGKLKAVGGVMKIAGYVELYNDNNEKIATQTLFEDAHKAFGTTDRKFINTVASGTTLTPVDITATFENVTGISSTSFSTAKNIKFYITADGGSPIYTAEDGGINPESSQIIGGIRVLDYDFRYPLETVNITKAYNESGHQIATWISSNTQNNPDWYKYPTSGKIY
jgi:hypothetical protein